jgi:hypothetical protein
LSFPCKRESRTFGNFKKTLDTRFRGYDRQGTNVLFTRYRWVISISVAVVLVSVHKFSLFVMPDLIRHPETLEKAGFRLSPE